MGDIKTAYFAGGCFWCITPYFQETKGVVQVTSGYSGGDEENPTYLDVKNQKTGHRETIRVDYDSTRITFAKLFDIFLQGVDPFDPDGQYIDRGHSYTLAVYCQNAEEHVVAREKIQSLRDTTSRPVYVSVEPFKSFYSAEEEHQDFYRKHPEEYRRELIESGRLKEE